MEADMRKSVFQDGGRLFRSVVLAVIAALGGIVVAAAGLPREPVLHPQASARKTFATVSVKRSDEFINPNPSVGNGRFVWHAAPLMLMVGYAYDASAPTIEGKIPVEPMYDIDATFAASATPRDIQEMLKNLLIDKFALRVHAESRMMSLFRLVSEAGGHKLRPSNTGTESRGITIAQGSAAWRCAGSGVTLPQIARALSNGLERPVLDATGITGTFDFEIVDTANPRASRGAFVGAVPHQLGLKLEPATGKVDVLVIDGFKML
jgi:uncharacterized protein (TIGR03435 family)